MDSCTNVEVGVTKTVVASPLLFTVVTVCRNEASSIQRTVRSVVEQQCHDFEYLVVDGGSQDNTVALAQNIINQSSFPAERFRCISEGDRGVYDGMNKGVTMARGHYIIFMNAGDSFYDAKALKHYADSLKAHPDADILYGSTLYINGQWQKIIPPHPIDFIRQCTPFCHQASATRRDLLLQNPFRLQFRIVADYDFFVRSWQQGANFIEVPHTLARFVMGGISNANILKAQHEVNRVYLANGLVGKWSFRRCELLTSLRQLAHNILPRTFWERRKRHAVSERTGWKHVAEAQEVK